MISHIRGRIVSAHPRCVVDVAGVGFELLVPEKDVESISPSDGEVEFFTYLYVREDRMQLFGFLHAEDRELFLKLIDVSGVGPRLALGIVSTHDAARVVAAIRGGDVAFLKQLPGLGKKTSERLVMELADKLDDIDVAAPATPVSSSVRDEVVLALTSLGMTRPAAEQALEKMNWKPDDDTSVEDVVKEALRYAGRV